MRKIQLLENVTLTTGLFVQGQSLLVSDDTSLDLIALGLANETDENGCWIDQVGAEYVDSSA